MTADAIARLEREIEELEGPARRAIAERIGVAREWGDLKENAEYHAAKDDGAMLEVKIARIRELLRSAEVVEAAEEGDGAGMNSTVTYRDEQAGADMTFRLVPAPEARPGQGTLSISSPVGRALTGSRAGDEVTLETPNGTRTVRVLAVEHA